jgi:tetratricopeptide (TPR) repeat protein
MLNIGGVKVAPAPLEAAVKRINGVADAVMMTVASPNGVGILLAAVEIDSDQPPSPDILRQISAILSQSVRTFEIMPLRWFPRTDLGKIKRREIEAAFRRQPENSRRADRLYLEAVVAQQMGRQDSAVDVIRQAISLYPEAAPYHCALGNALREQGRLDEAVVCYRKAIDLKPDLADAHYNLAVALMSLEHSAEAAASLQAAIRLTPDFPEALNALGVIHMQLGRPAEAIPHFREAIRLRSDTAEVHNNLGMALLAVGDMSAGWPEYEWRWTVEPGVASRRALAQPQWRGEAAEGRTLLIHAEQGLGDSLQFCRYAPLAHARGLRVVIEAPASLIRLLRRLPGVDAMVACGEALPDFDLHCPMLSLPLALGTTLATVPGTTPYLHADPAAAAAWQSRLAETVTAGTRVGLVWAGNSQPTWPQLAAVDRRRSLAPERLAPLLEVSGTRFFSLQLGGVPAPACFHLIDHMDAMRDFADTAALIANLDLVISVDTAVAHLAGALGKPVWLLDRFGHCWRWLAGRRDSPWYPTLRIYRQPCPGNWDAVLTEVARDLRRLVTAGRQRRLDGTSSRAGRI